MKQASLTGTDSFAARILRSEHWRVRMMAIALAITLAVVFLRRSLGGAVMSVDRLFCSAVVVLLVGLCYQGVVLYLIRRQARLRGSLPTRHWVISLAMDLAIPSALLLSFQLEVPDFAALAVSGPAVLLFPLTILLSILRLKPWFSLGTGVHAAAIHAALVFLATRLTEVSHDQLPVLFSYSVTILVIGMAASAVSFMTRTYVIEAIEEATLLQKAQQSMALVELDLKVARDIQLGLLPTGSPAIEDYEIAGMSRPATHAGGDYYDWQPLPDGRLLVAIADVTGHGIGPALVMAVCRAYARASAPVYQGPDNLMRQLNDLIYEDVKGARFITMAVALLNPNGQVELVSAGHGPTLHYHAATGQVECYGGDGLPLGIVASETYGPVRTLTLERDDVLVLVTDGFFEAMREEGGVIFGVPRLEDTVKACARQSPADIISSIDKAVTAYVAGAAQADDMTAVVIKRK